MAAPNVTFNLSATVNSVDGPTAIGDVLVPIAGVYKVATAANRATAAQRAHGLAMTAWGGAATDPPGAVRLQHVGIVDSSVTGLGAGAASWVRVSAAGRLERASVAGSDDVVGYCAADGTLFCIFGLLTAAMTTGGGGGGATLPIVLTTDVSGILPAANGGTGAASLPAGGLAGLTAMAAGDAASVATAATDATTKANAAQAAAIAASQPLDADLTAIAAAGLGAGVATWMGTPSGANLATALTTALPFTKGGTGLTALGSALQVLRTNAGVNAMEWATVSTFTPPTGTGVVTVTAGALDAASTGTTGSGNYVRATSPTVATPILTTPRVQTRLDIDNTGGTFQYQITPAALAANRILNLPLMTGTDTFTLNAFAATLTNKTMVLASNTITDTSAATGDLAKHNGTRFVRFARGTANQLLAVNAGATDIAYTSSPTMTDPVIASTSISNATAGGTINNCTLSGSAGTVRRVRFTNASGPTVTGFDATGVADGTILRVATPAATVAFTHEDALSTAANRITLQGGTTINCPAGCYIEFEYDLTGARWRCSAATAI